MTWTRTVPTVLLLLATTSAQAEDKNYARPDLLLEPAELAKPAVARQFIILDVRPAKKYDAEHVPGSHSVDPAAWVKAFGSGKDVDGWSKRLGNLGIGPDTKVLVYDDGVKDAAQTDWILRYWGIDDVRLLNGGWRGWKAGKYPVETGEAPAPKAVEVKLRPRPDRLATKETVLLTLKDKGRQLVDARSEEEYTGAQKQARRGGAIPGAKNLEWTDLLDPETQRFKSARELERLFKEAGIDPTLPTTAYCQTGRRSSVTVIALELLGNKDTANYFASWYEWGNEEDTPITPGKPRK